MSSRTPPEPLRRAPSGSFASSPPERRDHPQISLSASPESSKASLNDPSGVAFVKGGKRKRLSKVCKPSPIITIFYLCIRLAMLAIKVNVAATVLVSVNTLRNFCLSPSIFHCYLAPCSNWYARRSLCGLRFPSHLLPVTLRPSRAPTRTAKAVPFLHL